MSEKSHDLLNLVALQLLEKNIMRKAAEIAIMRKNEKLKKNEEEYEEISSTYESMQKDLVK